MKNFLKVLICLLCVGGVEAATPLGVLYESTTTNNVVSPATLSITNVILPAASASYTVQLDAAKRLVGGLLSSAQQDTLASWVSGTTTLSLGQAYIVGGSGTPTNGTAYIQRILYINTLGTNLNDTYWGNYGTNWYAIASTNGGSITENQLNFTDVTTANSTTNQHGLLPKLNNSPTSFLNGQGNWAAVSPTITAYTSGPMYGMLFDITNPSLAYYDTNFSYNAGSVSIPNLNAELGVFSTGLITPFISGFTDDTTGDVSITAHGLVPKAPNDSAKFLNGLGQWAVPVGGGGGDVGITGSPGAPYLAYWSGTNTITGSVGATFNGTTLSLNGGINTGSLTVNNTNGNVYAGTYTPTISNLQNCTTVGAQTYVLNYQRVMDIVNVSGVVQVIRQGSGGITFDLSVPVASTVDEPNISDDNFIGSGVISGSGDFNVGTAVLYYDLVSSQLAGAPLVKVVALQGSTTGSVRNFYINFSYSRVR